MNKSLLPLDNSFTYFDAVFHNSVENNILIIDEKGIVQAVNTAFTACFGYEPGDVTGKYFSIFFTDGDIKKGKPETELQNVLNTGQASDDNYFVLKDGSINWVSGESLLVKNEQEEIRIVKLIQDIDQQKKSELQINKLDTLNERILTSIEDAVIVLDEKLNILNANESFNSLFNAGIKPGQPVNIADIVKPYDLSGNLIKSLGNAFVTKKPFTKFVLEINISSQGKRSFDVSCSLMKYDGETNLLVQIHDVTALKELQKEREDVIGFVAHELRNPLANLVLCNELLGELIFENNIETTKDILQRSKSNVSRLNRLIGELYESVKVSSGNLKLDVSAFNFEEMIMEAIDTIKVLHPAFNIVMSGEANMEATGDRHRLIQVVTNYLSNGIKYSDGHTNVFLHVSHDADNVTVSVKDNGLGISQEYLPYIFDRFFRVEKTKNMEGIGLGLYLCSEIIKAHRGKVWAESEEGKGSVFYFSIPRQ